MEVSNTTETLYGLIVGDTLFAQDVSTRGRDSATLRQR